MPTFTAVDLGATSGRVVNVRIDGDGVELEMVHRFPTVAHRTPDGDVVWDFAGLLNEVCRGLRTAMRSGEVQSVAVDSWGIDYGLVDGAGRLIGPVHSYRSPRTDGVMETVCSRLGGEHLYAATGTQILPFNTSFQLLAAGTAIDDPSVDRLLMVPDLVNHVLCGSNTNDVTNASTTGLLDAAHRRWSDETVRVLGLRRDVLPELHEPGRLLGAIRGIGPEVDGKPVVAAASHDTASAVAGLPLSPDRPAIYISCGTWSLVGCEVASPVIDHRTFVANVTNELGVGGTVRLLKNVTGLWLLEECRRTWAGRGQWTDRAQVALAAAGVPGGRSVIDPDDARFSSPGDMPERIAAACRETGQPVPVTPVEVTRTILDSLALKWRRTIETIERVAGFDAESIHLVGGGAAIPLLRRLCASASGRPVLAGAVEATVVGNALVQAVAAGVVEDVDAGRELVGRALPPSRVEPELIVDWDALARRLDV